MTRFLRDLFFTDVWLKLISLALGILVYVVVDTLNKKEGPSGMGASQRTVFNGVPVEIVSSSGDVSRYQVEPAQVNLTLQGPPKIVNRLKAGDVHVMVDLSEWDGRSAEAQALRVNTPAGVTYTRLSRSNVTVLPPQAEP